jgi:hypothetical protein
MGRAALLLRRGDASHAAVFDPGYRSRRIGAMTPRVENMIAGDRD